MSRTALHHGGDLGAGTLLLALELAGNDEARATRYAALLGYQHEPREPRRTTLTSTTAPVASAMSATSGKAAAAPIFRVRLYGVREAPHQRADELPPPFATTAVDGGLSDGDCLPRLPLAATRLVPLVAPMRLWPALQKLIRIPVPGAIDLAALARHLARGRLPRALPRRAAWRGPDRLHVVLDQARHLAPLAPDMRLVEAELRRLAPATAYSGYRVGGHPQQVNAHWGAGRALGGNELPIPGAAHVVLISDLGLARWQPSNAFVAAWLNWLAALRRAGSRFNIVSPVSGAMLHLPQVQTLAGGRLHRPAGRGRRIDLAPALMRLKCALAFAVQVNSELLRAMRLADPPLAAWPELESLYLQDPEVQRSISPGLQAEAAARLRPGLAGWPVDAQRRVLSVLRDHHGVEDRAVEVTEILLWAAHASDAARAAEASAVAQAQEWLAKFCNDLATAPANPAARLYADSVWRAVARDECAQARYSRLLAPFWAIQERRRHAPPPPGLDPADVVRALGRAPVAVPDCWLVQQGDWLIAQAQPAAPGQSGVAGPLPARVIELAQGRRAWRREFAARTETLARLSEGPIRLRIDRRSMTIDELEAPGWVLEAGRDRQGAYGVVPLISGERIRVDLPLDGEELARSASARSTAKRANLAITHGLDAYGWYADLELRRLRKTPIQRLRWIPPGEFRMGSATGEPESSADEHPRHRVILTQGFWLADTACTQGLWSAVMGDNPSRFRDDPENPVENVSWYDVQGFLRELAALTGFAADLPSEAQWEYACRAGTETPFWWGEKLGTGDANYDGNHPYHDGEKGEYRERTLPVKSFKPNPWGLWQMHGNVWAWCRDGLRNYEDRIAVDPEGPHGEGRALRSGSWLTHGWDLRAAHRYGSPPGYRDSRLGFRFLLRSPGPGPGGPSQDGSGRLG